MTRISVLIIDDSVTIRAVMEQVILNDPMFDVAGIASNVDDARRMMRLTSHDIVTLDLSMPGTGGLEFLDELSSRTHSPVVVVSSFTKSGSPEEAEALGRGAVACFDKGNLLSNVAKFLQVLRKAAKTRDH